VFWVAQRKPASVVSSVTATTPPSGSSILGCLSLHIIALNLITQGGCNATRSMSSGQSPDRIMEELLLADVWILNVRII